jgi:hypothetical protein
VRRRGRQGSRNRLDNRRRAAGLSIAAVLITGTAACGVTKSNVQTEAGAGSPPSMTASTPASPAASAPRSGSTPSTSAVATNSGISSLAQAPFSQQEFQVRNQYHGLYHGAWVSIYAGAAMKPGPVVNDVPTESVIGPGVRVFSGPNPNSNSAAPTTYLGQFLIPGSGGWAAITAVSGGLVDLRTQSGTAAVFNLATRTIS